MEFNEELRRIIYFHRKKSGLSRVELSRLAGVGKTAIYDIEHGKTTIRLDILIKICAVLNISIIFDSPFIKRYEAQSDEKS